jgi:GNAT superfamily N-acetyltransferase
LRPFDVLSTGEQFRVTIARALCENPERMIVVDEFTSVIDRTVAQIGSAAIAKTVRRRNQHFVAVTCHEDVVPWLQPDWIYTTADNKFAWRLVQPRPQIDLVINRAPNAAWKYFAHHHYLTASLNPTAACFVAFYRDMPVAFDAWLPFFGKLKTEQHARRGHRTVCLPDFQGVGIGNALFSYCASLWSGLGYRAFSNTGHPAEIAHRIRSRNWRMTRAPGRTAKGHASIDKTRATNRFTASFEYIGAPLDKLLALKTLNSWARL